MEEFAAAIKTAFVPDRTVRLWRLPQAGFVVRGADRTVLFDPWLSDWLERRGPDNPDPVRRATAVPCQADELPVPDVVCCSHEHPDHFDVATLLVLAERSAATRFVVPAPIAGVLISAGVTESQVVAAEAGKRITVAGVSVLPLAAPHAFAPESLGGYDFWTDEHGRHRALAYVLRVGAVTVFHGGDTVRAPGDSERLRQESVDVALLPINGRDAMREAQGLVGNLHPAEAADLAASAGIPHLVPCHFDGVVGNTADPSTVVEFVVANSLPVTVHVAGPTGVVIAR